MTAAARIEELRKRYDENPRRFFAPLANEYRKSGDLDQAISICQAHLEEQPGNMNGHVVYGQALFEAGRYDEANTTFETALSLDPENLIALRHLGDIARAHGDAAQARQWYTRVLDADPRNDEIIAFLAELDTVPATAPVAESPAAEPLGEAKTVEIAAQVRATGTGTPVMAQTPVVPIESIITPVASQPASPPARQSFGLMDLSIDLGASADAAFDATTPSASTDPLPGAELESFGDISFSDAPIATPPDTSLLAEPVTPADGGSGVEFDALDLSFGDSTPEPEAAAVAEHDATADMLFGDTSFPAAQPEQEEPRHEEADALIGRTPAFGMDAVPEIAETPQAFVTETMAELYLQQGFRDEALDVYRQLAAQNPGDHSLQERVRQLESGQRSSLSLETVSDDTPDVAGGAVPIGAMLFETDASATSPGTAESGAAVPPAAGDGRSARDFFAALATRRIERRDPSPARGIAAAAPRTSGGAMSAGRASAPMVVANGSLDQLFGNVAVAEADELVALAFSRIPEVELAAGIKGKPTQPAATELSLDSVFRDTPQRTSRATAGVPRQSQMLRFDQFFAAAPDAAPDEPPVAPAAPAGEPGTPADLEQFHGWLQGLKKP